MYAVKIIDSKPTVVDAQGQPVSGAQVTSISFPSQRINGPNGSINILSGPGKAEIHVDGQNIDDVPVK